MLGIINKNMPYDCYDYYKFERIGEEIHLVKYRSDGTNDSTSEEVFTKEEARRLLDTLVQSILERKE